MRLKINLKDSRHFRGKGISLEIMSWRAMMGRCYDPASAAYPYYGGRNITVCERWHDFHNFYEDMHPRLPKTSLDRIDNSKGYSRENCKWSTKIEQQGNTSHAHNITWRGRTQNISVWARELGFRTALLNYKINNGWPLELAFTLLPNKDFKVLDWGSRNKVKQ